jgi:Arc/MetJ-type ribon-helix-helix transcriptional regulator
MTYRVSPEVARLIESKMAGGNYTTTDELLLDALQSLDTSDDDLKAIREGLEALDRGEPGKSLDEAFSALRKRHNISG